LREPERPATARTTYSVVHGLLVRIDGKFDAQSPQVAIATADTPRVTVRQTVRSALPAPRAHEWRSRQQDGLAVAHGDYGTFLRSYCSSEALIPPSTDDSRTLLVARPPSISADRFTHTVLHAFMPNALALWGDHVLHASAVVIKGRAYLFSAPSGGGKSTLAAGFLRRGARVLAEDVLRVERAGAGYVAFPSYPGARLRSGSFLLPGTAVAARGGRFGMPKHRVHLDAAAGSTDPVPIAAMFFLGRQRSPAPSLQPLAGGALMDEWMQCSFLAAVPRALAPREAFVRAATLARAIPGYRLRYRRSAAHFDALLDGIVELVGTLPR